MSHYYDFDPSLASNPRQITFEVCGETLTLMSDIGVFRKNRLDEGTMILLSTVEIFQTLVTVHLSGEVTSNSHAS